MQVAKEERGNKGAALTTYLSLAGRYLRADAQHRARRRRLAQDHRRRRPQAPQGDRPGSRGAGGHGRHRPHRRQRRAPRPRSSATSNICSACGRASASSRCDRARRASSMRKAPSSSARSAISTGRTSTRFSSPATRRIARRRAFMRMLMPSHAATCKLYREPTPIFAIPASKRSSTRYSPTGQLKSGGYIVINQTEALVAIDVNSGRAHARAQYRGDGAPHQSRGRRRGRAPAAPARSRGPHRRRFHRHGGAPQQSRRRARIKEAMKHDRARIQVGRIALSASWRCRASASARASSRPRPRPARIAAAPARPLDGSTALHVLRAIGRSAVRSAAQDVVLRCARPSRSTSSTRSARICRRWSSGSACTSWSPPTIRSRAPIITRWSAASRRAASAQAFRPASARRFAAARARAGRGRRGGSRAGNRDAPLWKPKRV